MTRLQKLKHLLSVVSLSAMIAMSASTCLTLFSGSSTNVSAAETTVQSTAAALDISVESALGYDISGLTDNSYDTATLYAAGDTLTVTSTSPMYGLYIKWDDATSPWTLSYNGKTMDCGTYGYVHEYNALNEGTTTCTITLTADSKISDIYAYSKGTLPDDVQVWEPACDSSADILVLSTHADDEILFLGGILALYGGEQNLNVQVVYLSNYWMGETVREHEKLDGLWTCGIKNYPVNSPYGDYYSQTLEQAKQTYDYDSVVSFFTEQIRRFKPQVLVTQDFDGEYGHGAHILLANAAADALEISMNAEYDSSSAATYGIWDVPKAYFHLYKENSIRLDLRQPSTAFHGRTPLEVVTEAYTKHVSQQKWDFIVSDDYEYSCAEYGLYRTTVGTDTGNDILEHVTTYEAQESARKLAEEESIAAEKEAQASSIAASEAASASEAKQHGTAITSFSSIAVIIAAAVVLVILVLALFILKSKKKKRRNRRR